MIAQIFPNRGGAGGAATISYVFGQTDHKDEHQAIECSFLTSNLLVISDPTVTFSVDEQTGLPGVGSIPASEADINPIIEQFEDLASRNERVQDPYWHAILSFSPEDEAKLDDGMMKEICEQFMSDMGFDDAAWVATVHRDTDNTHIHIAACTVQNLPGNPVVSRWKDYDRAMNSVRQIEADYGLREVVMPESGKKLSGPFNKATANEIRDIIDVCVKETLSERGSIIPQGRHKSLENHSRQAGESHMQTFVSKMKEFGVDVQFQFKQGKPTGISYSFDDRSFSGGKLRGGGRFTLPGLNRRGITLKESDHAFCEKVTADSKDLRARNDFLMPKRYLENVRPGANDGQASGQGFDSVSVYKHAEPFCLIQMTFGCDFSRNLLSSSCQPHYAIRKSKGKVDAYWRVGISRSSVNNRRDKYDFVDELLRKMKKKQRELDLEEQMQKAEKMNLIFRGMPPGQHPSFCNPRPGYIATDEDPSNHYLGFFGL